jgi:hypothetical protein
MNAYSCVQTIEFLRRFFLNVQGVIDVVDDRNCNDVIEMLKKREDYKEPNKPTTPVTIPWD